MRGRLLLVVVLALLTVLPATVPAAGQDGVPAPPQDPAPVGDRIVLDVHEVTPTVLRPGGEVAVTATLRNTGGVAATDLLVRLQAYTVRLPTRDAVDAWAQNRSGIRAGNQPLAETRIDELPPGGTAGITLSAPAEALGLSTAAVAWGPRGLTLEVLRRPSFEQAAVARAFTVWDPREEVPADERMPLSVLVPVTAGPPDVASARLPASAVDALTADDGRLGRLLAATSPSHAAWAVDPGLLRSAADTPAGQQWLAAARDAADGRDVLALPQWDPDLVALAAAGGQAGDLYALARRQGRDAVGDLLDSPVRAEAAWPAGGGADEQTLALAVRAGATAVVLGAGAHPPLDPDAVVSGRSTVPAGTDRLDGLLADTSLSTVLTDATDGDGDVLARSRLAAETAVLARAAGDDVPHLLVTLPRGWDPSPDAAADAFATLTGTPWTRPAPLDALLDAAPPEVERAAVRQSATGRSAALPAEGLRQVAEALEQVRRVSSALTRPEDVLEAAEASAVAATSVSWREARPAWQDAVAELGARAEQVVSGVHVVEGSTVNVVSAAADLPVTVANELDQDVSVVVSVQPRTPRLVADDPVEVVVDAGGAQRVAVPVRAVANGDTEVEIALSAPDGTSLGSPVVVPVRVRADWETRGLLVVGAVLALVLVSGLVRTIRRGRRRSESTGGVR